MVDGYGYYDITSDEQCTYCGRRYPRPIELHHSEAECVAATQSRLPWWVWRPICKVFGHRWYPLKTTGSFCRCSRPLRNRRDTHG